MQKGSSGAALILLMLGLLSSAVRVELVGTTPVSPYIAVVPEQTIDPSLTVGSIYTISLYIDYAGNDIYLWQFSLTYDPYVLQLNYHNKTDTWVGDGVTRNFYTSTTPIVASSQMVYVDDVLQTIGVNYTVTAESGRIAFRTASTPDLGAEVKVTYSYGIVNGGLISSTKGAIIWVSEGFNNTSGESGLTGAIFVETTVVTSGPGTMAYVNFTVVGTGYSDITLGDDTQLVGYNASAPEEKQYYKIIDAATMPSQIGHGYFDNNAPPPSITDVFRTPDAPNYDEEVTVEAIITDDRAVDVALLSFTQNAMWQNVTMVKSDDTFSATIPVQPYGTSVQYRILANDTEGGWAESELYSYVVEDFTVPAIEMSQLPEYPLPGQKVKVYANVTEPTNASRVKEPVFFSYRVNNGPWWNSTMVFNETLQLHEAMIPGYEKYDYVEYFAKAADNAGNTNTTATQHFEVLRCDANHNGVVDVPDIYMIGKAWNTRTGEPGFIAEADINEDGIVDNQDLTLVNMQYGKDP